MSASSKTPAGPRRIAFDILLKVESGGYASDLLRSQTASLDSRDAGLASEIVFGVLRQRAQLDYLIERYSGRRGKLDVEVRIALRMGIYQLRYLERIPAHAAVAQSVDLVKRAKKSSAAGFVNAVLRKVDRSPVEWPSREVEWSCPAWLLARWERHYGPLMAAEIARAALREPGKHMRGGRMQDIGSQSIVPLLDLRPGQRFLDLCAAPGNKTAQALEAGVRAVGCDLHLHRLAALKGLGADLVALDGTRPLPFGRRFERVLVDAPCSGTGTLGRNPEIKWKLRPEDLADFQRRQVALLRNALAVLAPGGILVYSTCSLEPEENEEVVAMALRETHPLTAGAGDSGSPALASGPHMSGEESASRAPGPGAPAPVCDTGDTGDASRSRFPSAGPRATGPHASDAQDARSPAGDFCDASQFVTRSPAVGLCGAFVTRLPGRDPGDGFFAAVIKSGLSAND